jgi:hypothetical protein
MSRALPCRNTQDGICRNWFCGGADRQHYRGRRDAYDAFLNANE